MLARLAEREDKEASWLACWRNRKVKGRIGAERGGQRMRWEGQGAGWYKASELVKGAGRVIRWCVGAVYGQIPSIKKQGGQAGAGRPMGEWEGLTGNRWSAQHDSWCKSIPWR